MKKTLIMTVLAGVLAACGEKSADEYFTLGQQAFEQKNYNEAVIELKNAVRLAPEDANYRYLLGQAYLEKRDYSFAEKEFEKAMDFGYPAEELIPILARIYRVQGSGDNLFKLNAKAKGLKPAELAKLKAYQVEAYLAKGNSKKAQVTIDELKLVPNGGPYAEQALVYQFLLNNDLASAIQQASQLLERHTDHADSLKLLGELYFRNQQVERAISTFEQYIALNNEDDEVKFRVARMLSVRDDFQRAEALVDQLLTKYPGHPLLLQLKAAARVSDKDYKQASQFAERSLMSEPEDRPTRLIAGISHYFLQEYEDSLADMSLVAGDLPADHPGLRILADTQLRLGLAVEASDTLAQFEQMSEPEFGLAAGVGKALVGQGEFKKAKAILAKQNEQISSPLVLANVAQLKLSLNDISGIADLEQALGAMDDANPELDEQKAQQVLARAYLATEQYDKAQSIAKQWQQNAEMQATGLMLESRIYRMQSQLQKAESVLLKGKEALPANSEILFALSEFKDLQQGEQRAEAKTLLEQGIALQPHHIPSLIKLYFIEGLDGKTGAVQAHIESQLKGNSQHIGLVATLARILVIEGDSPAAITLLEQQKQGTAVTRQILAQAYVKENRIQEVKDLYTRWYQEAPEDVGAILGMMKVYESRGEIEKAVATADTYLAEQGGESRRVIVARLDLLAKNGELALVSKGLSTLPEGLSKHPMVQSLKGQVALFERRFDDAERFLKIGYDANPSPRNASLLANAYSSGKGTQFAVGFLKQHLKAKPSDKFNSLKLGQMLTGKNNNEAKKYYLQALSVDDGLFIAHNNVAHMFLLEENLEQAHKHAKRAQELQPRQADVLDTLGYIEMKMGNTEKALEHLSLAIEAFEDKVPDDAMLNYIEALLQNGEKRLAQRQLERHAFSATANQRLQSLRDQYQL